MWKMSIYYKLGVANMINKFKTVCWLMSLKINFSWFDNTYMFSNSLLDIFFCY